MSETVIRPAKIDDAAVITAIYAHHVAHGTASFDYDAPDVVFWQDKVAQLAGRGWPFLVAEVAGRVAGYAYATQHRERPGYRFVCEDSIYVAPDVTGQGVGKALLSAVIVAARTSGFTQMLAVIGGGEPASVALHARLGFRKVGRLHQIGFKHGKLLDTIYMQRALAFSNRRLE